MTPQLRARAATQRGLVTRRQCEDLGYSTTRLRQQTRAGGPWVVVRRGVYVDRAVWEAADEAERMLLRDLAAHLVTVAEHVMSHDSAARALSIPMLRGAPDLAHVTREGVGGTRTESGVRHHLTRVELADVRHLGVMPLTGPARTALDLAREHGRDTGVVAIDHVRGRGVPLRELERELEVMRSWPHAVRVREALDLSDPRAESPPESLARLLLLEMGFDDVDVAWPVRVGATTYWTDLRVGCHVVEVDGLGKYLSPAEGGFADRSRRTVLRDERRRQAEICSVGLGMSRLVPDDLFGSAREALRARLEREHAVTVARFGPDLPAHLAEQAARIRRESPRRRTA